MNQTESIGRIGAGGADDAGFGLIDILAVLVKNKKLIVGLPLCVALLAAGVSMVIPDVFQARTKLMPPQAAQSSAASFLSQLGVAGSVMGAAGLKNSSELYVGMLRSRTVADKIIERFHLRQAYDTKSQEIARRTLEENTAITAGKDGLIAIEVMDRDRKRVAPIANAYVQELINLTQVLAVTEASQRRLFFERQLERVKDNLAESELALKREMETKGVVSVDADSRAIVETVGQLRARISAKEIELNAMRPFVTTANPDFQRGQEQLNSLKAELSKLENGREPDAAPGQGKSGQTGLESIRALRNVKYYQMLYELLAKQYEVARLDEAKDNSVIQVLDSAVEPERKFKPKRAFIVAVAGLVALFLALVWSFAREAKAIMLKNDSATAAKWAELKSQLKWK
jgi:uncharacterized protein involved in exopolysaccharide biosynthesis